MSAVNNGNKFHEMMKRRWKKGLFYSSIVGGWGIWCLKKKKLPYPFKKKKNRNNLTIEFENFQLYHKFFK